MANTRRPSKLGEDGSVQFSDQDPTVLIEMNLRHPERSRTLVAGQDVGSIQTEWRFGKQSGNEVVIRIPLERVKIRFVRK